MADRRDELLARRAMLVARLAELDGEVDGEGDATDRMLAGESRDVELARRDRLRAGIRALDVALERLADGRYGLCQDCGGAIAEARLRIMPDASRCLDCQARAERAG